MMMFPGTRFVHAAWLGIGLIVAGIAPTAAQESAPPAGETTAAEPSGAEAAPESELPGTVRRGEQVSVFTDIHVKANEIVRGQVVCIGCDAVVEGRVTDDIVVVGGSLKLSGEAGHDVVCVMSTVELAESARISHDFVNIIGSLDDAGAVIGNERINFEPFIGFPIRGGAFGVLGAVIAWGKVVKILVTLAVLLILVLFVPERIRILSDDVPHSYGLAVLAGLGGYVLLWVVNSLLLISVIGIPVAILLHLVFLVLKVLGLAGVFHFVGKRLGGGVNREMSLLGGILLGFLPFAILLVVFHFFGLIGFFIAMAVRTVYWILVELPAVGLILLTRAGGRPRDVSAIPATAQTPSAGVVPPAPPPPPAAAPPGG